MTRKPETDEEMAAIRVSGSVTLHNAQVYLAPYDPAWPAQYAAEAAKIRAALGDGAIVLEHVGSTSIPGIPAKPIIDILLAVANSADEDSYVPALTARGYRLHLREPDWEQHRVMKGVGPDVNLHVFTVGSREIERMVRFPRPLPHPSRRAATLSRDQAGACRPGLAARSALRQRQGRSGGGDHRSGAG